MPRAPRRPLNERLDMRRTRGEALDPLLSDPDFEIFPSAGIEEEVEGLPGGARVAVTCSPTKGIDATLAVTAHLSSRGIRVVPHISARLVTDERHLRRIIERLAQLEVREVFVIGGDAKQPAGVFPSALSLLEAMARLGHDLSAIGVGAYPESHPLIDDDTLWEHLEAKQSFATYMVTQMCFDAAIVLGWIDRARRRGIDLPVRVGLPGVIGRKKLLQLSLRIGVGDSTRFVRKHAGLMARMVGPGTYRPDDLVTALSTHVGEDHYKLEGLHIYTFNQVAGTEAWRQAMLRSGR